MLRGGMLLLGVLIASGCASGPSIPQNVPSEHPSAAVDQRLLAAGSQHFGPAHSTRVAPPVGLPPRVTFDRAQSIDTSLALPSTLVMSLRNLNIVRVRESTSSQPTADNATAFDIEVAKQEQLAALAAFDANLEASVYGANFKRPPNTFFGPGLTQPNFRDELNYTLGVSKPLQAGGALGVAYNPDPAYLFIPAGTGFNPTHVGQLEFSLAQPLLRGGGFGVNQAPIQISQIGVQQSAWEFTRAIMDSVRDTVAAYWDLYAARAELQAIDDVIPAFEKVAQLQSEAFKTEWVIKADVAKAYAQLHFFRQKRLELESKVAASELRLRSLAGLPPSDGRRLTPMTIPIHEYRVAPADHLFAVAMSNHPDLVQQRLKIKIRELELLVAKNALLPQVDVQALYRMNGVGENLPDAVSQLSTAEFSDWEVGATLSVPIGRRRAIANTAAAELGLARDHSLLHQQSLTIAHRLSDTLQRIKFTQDQLREADLRLKASNDWVRGARLRFENPSPDVGGRNWLLASLNDYLDALRFRTDAASDRANLLARYNTALAQLQHDQGTILYSFGIEFPLNPCLQGTRISD